MTTFNEEAAADTALQIYEPDPGSVFTIDAAAHLARVSRHLIVVCCRHGLIAPLAHAEIEGFLFDQQAIRRLQHIGYLHDTCGINFVGIRMILDLADEVTRLGGSRR
jgi:hypothetical protein